VRALTESDYGKLLLAKVALFLGMVALATINRFWLTPALAAGPEQGPTQNALRQLRRNRDRDCRRRGHLAIVAVLGVPPPGIGE